MKQMAMQRRAAARPKAQAAGVTLQGPRHTKLAAMSDLMNRPSAVQRQPAATGSTQHASPNRTGLPDRLKAGVEALSGMSLDHVRVHRNSGKPAQLQAHAFAQGSDIHLGPGQEKQLPHEAWHVVQQAQGRAPRTAQRLGVAINDNPVLEHEADTMGAVAAGHGGRTESMAAPAPAALGVRSAPTGQGPILQGVWNSKTTWNEAGSEALKRIFSIIGRHPVVFLLPLKDGSAEAGYFFQVRAGATWISSEMPFGEGNIFHFTVIMKSLRLDTEPQANGEAFDARLTVTLENFHQTVRSVADAQKFQAAPAAATADKKASGTTAEAEEKGPKAAAPAANVDMKLVGSAQKKLLKAEKDYEREFIHKKANAGKFKPWNQLSIEEKVAHAQRISKKPMTKEEAAALVTYRSIQKNSVHASATGNGKLQAGNKANTNSAAQALNINPSDGRYAIPGALKNFKGALEKRLTFEAFELPGKDNEPEKMIFTTHAAVDGG